MWHTYLQIAVMNYNTSYHERLGCEPTTVFHGRIPYNILDIKLRLKTEWKKDANEDLTEEIQKQIAEIHQSAKRQPDAVLYTRTLHKISLNLFAPNQQQKPDVTVRREIYLSDPELKTTHNDWYAHAWETEFGDVLFGTPTKNSSKEGNDHGNHRQDRRRRSCK